MTSGIDAALAEAVSSGGVLGAVAEVWSDRGTYSAVAGESVVGQSLGLDSMFYLASMTKTVTAVATMQLIERGLLDLEDPAGDMVPYVRDVQVLTGFGEDETPQFRSPSRPITIRHLLTHTAGFAYDFHNETTARYVATLPPAQRWTQAYFEDPLVFDPGEGWAYGAGIDWLGQAVEAVAGERLDTYFERHILGPLGMKDTTFTPSSTQVQRLATNHSRTADGLEPDPYPVPPEDIEFHAGGQGLYGTASDYLRLTRMLLNGGTLDNERILTPETVALMFADQLDSTMPSGDRRFGPQVAADLAAFVQEDSGWGLSFQIHRQGRPNRRSPGALSWMGACNTFFWIDPAQHLTGVFTTQVTPLLDPLTVKAFGRFERAVYDTFGHGIPG